MLWLMTFLLLISRTSFYIKKVYYFVTCGMTVLPTWALSFELFLSCKKVFILT